MKIKKMKRMNKSIKGEVDKLSVKEKLHKMSVLRSEMIRELQKYFTNDHLKASKILDYINIMIRQNGLENDVKTIDLLKKINLLNKTIENLQKGLDGEKAGRDALELIKLNEYVRILSNVELENDKFNSEIDNLVITKKGIFGIEIKAYNIPMTITESGMFVRTDGIKTGQDKNIGMKMTIKEILVNDLLKKELAKKGYRLNVKYQGIVLWVNDIELNNESRDLMVCYRNNISQRIRDYEGENIYSKEQVKEIEQIFKDLNTPKKYACNINLKKMHSEFKEFMNTIQHIEYDVNIDSTNRLKKNSIMEQIKNWILSNILKGKSKCILSTNHIRHVA